MGVQFGRWNWDGQPLNPTYLAKVKGIIAPYGPDDEGTYAVSNLCILYRAFHTTRESRVERQPQVAVSGDVITWDGRLDNRAELIRLLRDIPTNSATDLAIVAAAYEKWGTDCLGRLIGDWALSIWQTRSQSLILAKDPIGTRPLYYFVENDQVTWSTILDPLVLLADKTFALCEEYIAGWLSLYPATHQTPYVGICSVPPSSCLLLSSGNHTASKYWDFNSNKEIRYRTDREYEEHFRIVFAEAVRRRLRSDGPILAELSGGMDSSSIVCMADTIIASGAAETPQLDTISYYDDSEPNWNERPYFVKIEERRGRTGHRIDLGSREISRLEFESSPFAPIPGTGEVSAVGRQLASVLRSEGSRVILSGIGGDEVTGGVPTPIPELCTLLRAGQFLKLARELKQWALDKRRPWFFLLFEAVCQFLPPFGSTPEQLRPAPWLDDDFVLRHRAALVGYLSRLRWFGPSPSFQENLNCLDLLRRQAHCSGLSSTAAYEKRYPFLDRDLLEFLFAIPRDQIVRAGQRRSLMRRALSGIVPDEILKRRRKAFVARAPMIAISEKWSSVFDPCRPIVAVSLGIASAHGLRRAIADVRASQTVHIPCLMRTFAVEVWLRNLTDRNLLHTSRSVGDRCGYGRDSAARSMPFLAENNFKRKGGENYEIREAGDRSKR